MRALILPAVAVILGTAFSGGVTAATTPRQCETRIIDTPWEAADCIQRDSLWRHLRQFQKIADENPGIKGHGNRNTGTPGYKASVDYVARLMRQAGYRVTIQHYKWRHSETIGTPVFAAAGHDYDVGKDWSAAQLSGNGRATSLVQPAGDGCSPRDFAGFVPGRIALVTHALCPSDSQVANAEAAGAAAVLFYSARTATGEPVVPHRVAAEFQQQAAAKIPVVELRESAIGAALAHSYAQGHAAPARVNILTRRKSDTDYNVIAESSFGDPGKIVVVDAHLDAIYGAGMLDNASGSTTILDTALALARTKTANRLRYIWFGGEEIGLLGSRFYTKHLDRSELKRIVFDIDVDVTATPNFDVLIADPGHSHNAYKFPPNVLRLSRVGNKAFADYFRSVGIPSQNAAFGNDGTDSKPFSLVGVPNSGILTQQDCCKRQWEVDIWGGYLGNYEGKVPGHNGGCVDWPERWCDNLSNNDPFVLEFVSKAVAYVTLELANDKSLKH